jgi:hypothetical protein
MTGTLSKTYKVWAESCLIHTKYVLKSVQNLNSTRGNASSFMLTLRRDDACHLFSFCLYFVFFRQHSSHT